MKKIALILAVMMAALCLLCTASAEEMDALAEIKAKGKLVVACEGTYSPWNYEDENGVLMGYDVEVAQAIAAKLGVEFEPQTDLWDGLFAGLDSGRFDLVIASVEITEERALKYDFSTPYAYTSTVVITKDDNDTITSLADLAGKTTCNTATSVYAKLAEDNGATVLNVDDLAQTIELVLTGRCDATLNADTVYYDYLRAHPDAALKIAATSDDVAQIVVPVPKGEKYATLLEAINQALAELAEDGTLTELSIKYFGGDLTVAK